MHTLPISTHGPQKSGLGVGSVAYVGVGGSGVGVGAAIVWIATAAPFRLARTSGFSHGEGVSEKEAEALLGAEVATLMLGAEFPITPIPHKTTTTNPPDTSRRPIACAVWKIGDDFTHQAGS